jgi:hypothetical protein
MQDDFPGEPFDQVALSGRTSISLGVRAAPAIQGAEASALAGDVSVSIQNDTATTGVIIADSRFQEMQARVALLETSVSALRREMNMSRRAAEVGIGHNLGPEFELASAEELDDIDDLIALLKEQRPNARSDPANLIERSRRATDIAEKINQGLLVLGTELAKGAAREAGKEMLIPLWTAVSSWIISVGPAVVTWLGV